MLIQSSLVLLALLPAPAVDTPAETPKKVELKLIPEQGSCGSGYKAETDENGALQIGFDDLTSESKMGKYRASCRLAGELTIPRGYRLDPSAALSGVVMGQLGGGFDNFTGRLKFGLGRFISRDFQLAEYQESGKLPLKLDLKAAVPAVPLDCNEDITWPASLFIESTINGGASAKIEYLKLDGLTLVAGECPVPTREPLPVPNPSIKR